MRRNHARGRWLVIGLFLLGGVVLSGFFIAGRVAAKPPAGDQAVSPDLPFGAPARPLRVLSYNILHCQRGLERVAAEVRQRDPDIVLLQEVESRDCAGLARAL